MGNKLFREEIRTWAFAFLTANLILRGFIALRPLAFLDNQIIPDDTYLALTIARNIARGLGPLYGDYYTNGFQPLYVFLISPFFVVWPENLFAPVHASLILLAVFDTIALFFFLKIIDAWNCRAYVFKIGALLWIFNSYFIGTALNGLETVLSTATILCAVWCFQKFFLLKNNYLSRDYAVLGLVIGISVLARIDNIILGVILTFSVVYIVFKKRGLAQSLRALRVLAGTIILTILPWLVYSYIYTGTIYPVSGRAVRFMTLSSVHHNPTFQNCYLPMLGSAGHAIVGNSLHLIIGIFAALVIFRFVKRTSIKDACSRPQLWVLGILTLFSFILFIAYSFYIFAPWFFSRYFYPVAILLLFAVVALLDALGQTEKNGFKTAAVLGIGLVVVEIAHPGLRRLIFSKPTNNGYMNVGLWAQKAFKNGTVIGGSQTGALGYFAPELKVVNLDGVVSNICFDYVRQGKTMEFVRKANVEYIINCDENHRFLKENSAGFSETDVTRLFKIENFQSWNTDWIVYKVNY